MTAPEAHTFWLQRPVFHGNTEAAKRWQEWNEARPKPRLRDHFVRLWHTLRKGRTK